MIWLDALRLIAGVSMVGLHSTADPNGAPWAAYEPAARFVPLAIRAVIYIARTELFIIIALFLLLLSLEARQRSYSKTIREQARRLLLPFIFWCMFFAFYNLVKANAFGYADAQKGELADWRSWVGYLLLGSVKYHMHFLPTLFGVVLFYPLFRLAIKFPAFGLGVIACLLVKRELDAVLYAELLGHWSLPYAVRAVKIVSYTGYGLVAASCVGLWHQARLGALAQFVPLLALGGMMLFSFKGVSSWYTLRTGEWQPTYTPGYWADFLMPVLLFVGAMALAHRAWPAVLSRLAPYSFGVYLCHPIFLDLAEIALRGTQLSPALQVLFKVTFAVLGTSFLVGMLQRTHLLAWTVGLGRLPFSPVQPRQIKRPEQIQ